MHALFVEWKLFVKSFDWLCNLKKRTYEMFVKFASVFNKSINIKHMLINLIMYVIVSILMFLLLILILTYTFFEMNMPVLSYVHIYWNITLDWYIWIVEQYLDLYLKTSMIIVLLLPLMSLLLLLIIDYSRCVHFYVYLVLVAYIYTCTRPDWYLILD